jgi:hypothetical protein
MLSERIKYRLRAAVPGGSGNERFDAIIASVVEPMARAVVFAIGTEATNAIAVAVQLQDVIGNALSEKKIARYWLSDTPGGAETGTGPATSTAISGGVSKKVTTTKIAGEVVTDANGGFVVTLTETGVATWYLNIEVDGRIYTSGAITFA